MYSMSEKSTKVLEEKKSEKFRVEKLTKNWLRLDFNESKLFSHQQTTNVP